MRKTFSPILLLLLTGSSTLLFFSGCFKDRVTRTYAIYTPVYTSKSTIVANINGSPLPFDSIGKIYVKDQFIFLNELNKGIHIIDNGNPANPVQIAFLNIPGNQDMAVKDNILYADMYTDLLAIDISNPRQTRVSGMVHNLFSMNYNWYLNGTQLVVGNNGDIIDSGSVITGWKRRDTTVTVGPTPPLYYWGGMCSNCPFFAPANSANSGPTLASTNTGTGTGGSMAKMTLVNNYLYAIAESHTMSAVDVSNPAAPSKQPSFSATGFDLETIFPLGDKLFLGSKEGVYIYDISDPAKPVLTGQFQHGRACDPVVSDGNYAYVTLHAGTTCGGNSNELDVLNIQNLQQPTLVKTYPMTSPQGLCKDNNLLFVCDGSAGVKLYDATDPANLQLLTQIATGSAYDVIAMNHRLLVVATNGLYQYDYSNPMKIGLLSFFPVK